MLSICDVVLNHTANETAWLAEHPEAAYNARDCPYLRPAVLLDAALARLTRDVAQGRLAPRLPSVVCTPEHLEVRKDVLSSTAPPPRTHPFPAQVLREELAERVLPVLRLHELFQCDAADVVRRFCQVARNKCVVAQWAGPAPRQRRA